MDTELEQRSLLPEDEEELAQMFEELFPVHYPR